MINEFLLLQSSAWENTKSHSVLDLGKAESGQELRFDHKLPDTDGIVRECIVMVEPCLVAPQHQSAASNSVIGGE